MPKDNFSSQSSSYSKFRPDYPAELFRDLYSRLKQSERAWDCATGNGQVARVLAQQFDYVEATDISEAQLEKAPQYPNVTYSCQPAEKTIFPNHSFDLITVAQALHWFDHPNFFDEVKRVGKKGAILAVWTYGLLSVSPAVDLAIGEFYQNVVGPFWDPERRHVDEAYASIDFPFSEVKEERYASSFEWTFDHLMGYLETWSATQHYRRKYGTDPRKQVEERLLDAWEGKVQKVRFPIILRWARL